MCIHYNDRKYHHFDPCPGTGPIIWEDNGYNHLLYPWQAVWLSQAKTFVANQQQFIRFWKPSEKCLRNILFDIIKDFIQHKIHFSEPALKLRSLLFHFLSFLHLLITTGLFSSFAYSLSNPWLRCYFRTQHQKESNTSASIFANNVLPRRS